MKYLTLVIMLIVLTGCASEAAYMQPPPGAVLYGSGPVPLNPDQFKVDPDKYPAYVAIEKLKPPTTQMCWPGGCLTLEMAEILPTDVWKVTHVFRGKYMIESTQFENKQCNLNLGPSILGTRQNPAGGGTTWLSRTCQRAYDYVIYITPDGQVAGGWELLPGPGKILEARNTYLSPSPEKTALWPRNFSFVKEINNSNVQKSPDRQPR